MTKISVWLCLLSTLPVISFGQKSIKQYENRLKAYSATTSLELVKTQPDSVLCLKLNKQKLTQLPEEIRLCKNLEVLDLKNNQLDSLPPWLVELPQLKYLIISRNKFENIPQVVCSMTQLQVLRASDNYLEGIPWCLSKLINLEYLDIWNNDIEKLPTEIEALSGNLKILDMRVTATNKFVQEEIYEWLPNTELYFSSPCNCGNNE